MTSKPSARTMNADRSGAHTKGARVTLAPGLGARRVPFKRIPRVDLGPLIDGSDKARAAEAIGKACREVGFLYIENHGVPPDLVARTFAEAERFFALPTEDKMRVAMARSPNHRGYYGLFEENTDPTKTGDLKEGFDIALELGADDPDVIAGKPYHGPNQWPAGLPGFRETLEEYYAAMRGLAATLMRGFALALRLDEDFFDGKIAKPLAQLRTLHYPPQAGHVVEDTLGCGAHTDYGCLTILAQDAVGGLQVQNVAGDWIAAPPVPGTFVVNIGDQMARWTNGLFAATVHRVINTSGRERYSVPFFFDPDYDAWIECLPSCRDVDHPPKYPPVKAGEYLMQRFNETYVYRGAGRPQA